MEWFLMVTLENAKGRQYFQNVKIVSYVMYWRTGLIISLRSTKGHLYFENVKIVSHVILLKDRPNLCVQ